MTGNRENCGSIPGRGKQHFILCRRLRTPDHNMAQPAGSVLLEHPPTEHPTEGHIKIFFYSKNLVEACVGATGLDWVFPEPK